LLLIYYITLNQTLITHLTKSRLEKAHKRLGIYVWYVWDISYTSRRCGMGIYAPLNQNITIEYKN
jgi:hypothetical protein